jgi:hypothetical protein
LLGSVLTSLFPRKHNLDYFLGGGDLLLHRLGRLDRSVECRIIGRRVAPSEDFYAVARTGRRLSVQDFLLPSRIVRHKQRAHRVMARQRQGKAERGGLLVHEFV